MFLTRKGCERIVRRRIIYYVILDIMPVLDFRDPQIRIYLMRFDRYA